jgi:hypothetical protein
MRIGGFELGSSALTSSTLKWLHRIQCGFKLHLVCLELCTPAYSLHPKLHFDTNLIFVSLLVPEILAHFFCPSGQFFLEKMKKLQFNTESGLTTNIQHVVSQV